MKDILNKILGSLDTHTANSFSARKLSAFAGVLIGYYITCYKLPVDQQINALYAWLLFALLCLGIITFEQIIKFKNGNSNQPSQQ